MNADDYKALGFPKREVCERQLRENTRLPLRSLGSMALTDLQELWAWTERLLDLNDLRGVDLAYAFRCGGCGHLNLHRVVEPTFEINYCKGCGTLLK